MPLDDLAAPFQIENQPVRGRLARMGESIDEILTRHDYPPAVANLLGETCALAALVGASLKFEGRRHNLLQPYQVNAGLMQGAAADAVFMHCLPAHRGEEVGAEVIDGPQSVVFDEAENRLHAQKGLLAWCLHADGA